MRKWIFTAAIVCILAPFAGATGFMVPRDVRLPALELESHRVTVQITDQSAVTRVVEVFRNQHKRELEATFIFPLPKGAAVSDFKMYVDGKLVTGEIMEAPKARQIYQDIVRRARDPGLLEYMDSQLLRLSVYPVPARGTQEVQIEYAEALEADEGLVEYLYPLKTPQAAATTMKDFTLTVDITTRAGIKNIYSPTHDATIRRIDDHHATASFEKSKAALDRNFQLFYALSDAEFGASVISYKPSGEDGYFLLLLSPKVEVAEEKISPKDVAFVLDTSGSMRGEKIAQAKKALQFCISSLNDTDHFTVITFSNAVEAMSKELLAANADNRQKAAEFIEKLKDGGGTDIHSALLEALGQKPAGERPYIVVFLTDGLPTVGKTDIGRILDDVKDKNESSVRIFSFGVGHDVNTKLLDELTSMTRAYNQYVHPGEDIEVKVSSFFKRVGDPLLSGVEVDFGAADGYDVYPAKPGDLFRGTQLVIAGRYRRPGGATVTLKGRGPSRELAFEYPVDLTAESEAAKFVSNIWAGRKIGFLLREIRLHGENRELKDEVIRLSKEHGIVTPYTSYLVTEGAERVPVAGREVYFWDSWAGAPVARGGEAAGRALERRINGRTVVMEEAEVRRDRSAGRPEAPAPLEPADAYLTLVETGYVTSDAVDVEVEARLRSMGYMGGGDVSGKEAVTASEAMQFATRGDKVTCRSFVSKASGRNFVNIGGVWVDQSVKKDLEIVKVKFASDAYFALYEALPKFRDALALGEKLVIAAGKYVLIIDDEGEEKAGDAKVKAIVKTLSGK